VRYWLHQTKLLEGVDDPSFVAVAIYDVFGNARQLVQQIGRVLRFARPF
jgi:superfamily II DNA or RNA helicase